MIPISVVRFGAEEEELVLGVLRSGRLAQGSLVEEFERRFAELCGTRHAVAVNNGTTALIAALHMQDLGPGDEVITSPFTFAATLNAILEAGATARFVDISEDDFAIDPARVEDALSQKTRVIMPVHLYGQAADMSSIMTLASEHGLAVVEDAAQAHGAGIDGRQVGSFGIGAFSFYATKNITTGEGGMITTDDDDVAARLRILRNQGMRARYEYVMAGQNYRMTDLQAALALPQLDRYADSLDKRRTHAALLTRGLEGIEGVVLPRVLPGRTHVWHQYTIRLTAESGLDRDQFVAQLADRGVGAGIYYPKLVFDYEPYRNHSRVIHGDLPVASRVAQEVVSLPVHPHLSLDDVERVADTVRAVLERKG